MSRQIHKILGIIGGILVIVVALSGAWLSTYPAFERGAAGEIAQDLTIAETLEIVTEALPEAQKLTLRASGIVLVQGFGENGPIRERFDPETGRLTPAPPMSKTAQFMTELHRALFLGDQGRMIVGAVAALMALLSLTGLGLLLRRLGGFRAVISPMRGNDLGRWHSELGRFALLPLLLSAVTGVWLTFTYFEILPTSDGGAAYPVEIPQGAVMSSRDIAYFAETPLATLREIELPAQDDDFGVYNLRTGRGELYISASTGEILSQANASRGAIVNEWIFKLHTGEGLWWLGLILGVGSLAGAGMVPLGWVISYRNAGQALRPRKNTRPVDAEICIFVGSEMGSTNRFALALHDGLVNAGYKVHTVAMKSMAEAYPVATSVLILTSTYGDGAPPRGAEGFLRNLKVTQFSPDANFSVLGFGDRAFEKYCGFAEAIDATLEDMQASKLLPLHSVNKKSAQEFTYYVRNLEEALGCELAVDYRPQKPKTHKLRLIERRVYGEKYQAEAVILRFAFSSSTVFGRWFAPKFHPGDLLAVYAGPDEAPRYYSLASSSEDGVVDIAVRRVAGGVCSNYLFGVEIGAEIDAAILPTGHFHPDRTKAPLILIGAGVGVSPFVGMARLEGAKRPVALYQGLRDPEDDGLFVEELAALKAQGRLEDWYLASSRVAPFAYVQHLLRRDAKTIADALARGGAVMVCGSRAMADAVDAEFQQICEGEGLTLAALKSERRYLEDVF